MEARLHRADARARQPRQLRVAVLFFEREAVHRSIAKLVRHDAANHLTADGVGEFNQYAHGGFDVLLDWFNDRPRSLETFERQFKRKLDAQLASGL